MKVLVSVHDRKMSMFTLIMAFNTVNEAIREFGDSLTQGNRITLHPDDYSLMMMGEWDDETGEIRPEAPKFLVSADMILDAREQKKLNEQRRQGDLFRADVTPHDEKEHSVKVLKDEDA